jgi:hypothetical protein
MDMEQTLKEKAKEAIKLRPEMKEDILDRVEEAFDEINDEGSVTLECERAIDYIQNIIDGKEQI